MIIVTEALHIKYNQIISNNNLIKINQFIMDVYKKRKKSK
jgi:hypothetical protein